MASQVHGGLCEDPRYLLEIIFAEVHDFGEEARYIQVVMYPIGGKKNMASWLQGDRVKLGGGCRSAADKFVEYLATALIAGDLNSIYKETGITDVADVECVLFDDGHGEGGAPIVSVLCYVVMGLGACHFQRVVGGRRFLKQLHDGVDGFIAGQVSTGMPTHSIGDEEDSPGRVKGQRVFVVHAWASVGPGPAFQCGYFIHGYNLSEAGGAVKNVGEDEDLNHA